jgi:toxin ParE1/3/4
VIEWTEQAVAQLDQAHDYIALRNSVEVSNRVIAQIIASIQLLASFPLAGRAGRGPGTRELVITNTPFIATYRVEAERVVILTIYRGAQKWPDTL